MNPYIEKLKSYVAEHDPNFGGCDVHSLVELLYEWYTHFNPICSEQIHAAFKALDDCTGTLPFELCNQIGDLTCELCTLHERQAFFEGFHVGVRLTMELLDEMPSCICGSKGI